MRRSSPRRVPRRLVLALAGVLVVIAGAGAVGWGLSTGVLQLNHPSSARHPVRGIDVSAHQVSVDWGRVRAQGFSFAYLKATEGGDFTDPRFRERIGAARAAGLQVGAYHYFTFCRPGADQARHAIDVVRPVTRPGDLPLVVDLEFGGNCSHTPSPGELDREFGAFDEAVRRAFGRSPVLYVTAEFRRAYLDGAAARGSALAGHRLWVRDVYGRPDGDCQQWSLWQYANRGRVAGIPGPVDLNTYCGDRAGFAAEFGTPSNSAEVRKGPSPVPGKDP